MTYEAIISRASTRVHPNANALQLADVNGYTIVIGLDVPDGTVGVFFPCDGQLSPEFAEANDLIQRTDPDTGERKGGYFAANRRVRSQRLRGEKSEGFWTTLDSLAFTGYDISQLKEGDKFDSLNGVPICNKYYTPATIKQMNARKNTTRKNKCFPKHVETEKLQYEVDSILPGSIIYITEKLHGTSGRYAYVRDEVEVKPSWFKRLFGAKPKVTNEYDFLVGTRNMILGKSDVPSFYGSEEFRVRVGDKMKKLDGSVALNKGEVIYGEIVGYTHTGASIMGEHDASDLKEIKKLYGKRITYKYGNIPGACEFYVYRIAQVNDDGESIDLPWPQVKKRCRNLGLKTVPEIYDSFINSRNNDLISIAEDIMEGPSLLDASHLREGVVFRVESPDGNISYLKSKSFTFGVLEGYIKQSDDYVDIEEVS